MATLNNLDIGAALSVMGVDAKTDQSIKDIINSKNLSDHDIFERLGYMVSNSQSEAVQLRAIELVMQSKNLLKPKQENNDIVVNINIVDPDMVGRVNPILIPRKVDKTSDVAA